MNRGRVLLLEDDVALRGLLQEALVAEGFEVIMVESFPALRQAAAQKHGDIVLADFWGGGQRTLLEGDRREIAELGSLLPVVLLTGRSWASTTSAEELGARGLMRKPFDLDELLRMIEQVLSRAERTPEPP